MNCPTKNHTYLQRVKSFEMLQQLKEVLLLLDVGNDGNEWNPCYYMDGPRGPHGDIMFYSTQSHRYLCLCNPKESELADKVAINPLTWVLQSPDAANILEPAYRGDCLYCLVHDGEEARMQPFVLGRIDGTLAHSEGGEKSYVPKLYRRPGKYQLETAAPSTSTPSRDAFAKAAEPLIQWMAENLHPHHVAIVTSTEAQLLEGTLMTRTTRFLRD